MAITQIKYEHWNTFSLHQSGTEKGISGTILKSSYLGDHLEYTIECELGNLFVIDNEIET